MTNNQIILNESVRLMQEGVLKIAGYMDGENENGEPVRIALPEEIHTFNGWKSLGFIVKKGEHARAAFPVWKYKSGRRADSDGDGDGETDGETVTGGRCYLRKAFWFTRDQVQEITA